MYFIMNTPAPASQQQPQATHTVSFDLLEIIELITLHPESHKPANWGLLRILLYNTRESLSRYSAESISFAERLQRIPSISTVSIRENEIEGLMGLISSWKEEFGAVAGNLRGILAVMGVLESTDSLRNWNKAYYEDLERLITDLQEDVARMKARLQEMR